MNKPNHHPELERLALFSSGSLYLSEALCISAHIEVCEQCRGTIQHLNQVGSELLTQLDRSPVSVDLKSRVLAQLDKIDDLSPTRRFEYKRPPIHSNLPRCLRSFLDTDYHNLEWNKLTPDISNIELCRDSNAARVELLKIRPGGTSNTHTHLGNEYTVILEGSFSDENGLYQKGDFIARDASHAHTPVASLNGDCICLAVTEAPVQLTGWFGRLFNPMLRRKFSLAI
ncbi:MAG: putative transcriptional regulator [Gammaproteobacteria bacterium]|jgi:putative transcriptional regulator